MNVGRAIVVLVVPVVGMAVGRVNVLQTGQASINIAKQT